MGEFIGTEVPRVLMWLLSGLKPGCIGLGAARICSQWPRAMECVNVDPGENGGNEVVFLQGGNRDRACPERKRSSNQDFHLSTPTHATCAEMGSKRACGEDRRLRYADIVTGLTSPNASRRVRVSGRSPDSRVDLKSSRPHLPMPMAQWFYAVSGSLTVAWAAPDLHPLSGRAPASRFSPGKRIPWTT